MLVSVIQVSLCVGVCDTGVTVLVSVIQVSLRVGVCDTGVTVCWCL